MDFEKTIKIISRTLSLCFITIFASILYLESKGHIYSDGFDIWGRLGLRADKVIKEKSLYTRNITKASTENVVNNIVFSDAVEAMTKDRIIGSLDADITIYEFSSFDCPACAVFHKTTVPDIKESYVKDNRAAFVFRDFPLRNIGLSATILTKCVPYEEYYNFVDFLMQNQADFVRSSNGVEILKEYAADFGLSYDEAEACLNNDELRSKISHNRKAFGNQYDIKSTPTIIIENKQGKQIKLVGAKRFADLDKVLKELETEKQ